MKVQNVLLIVSMFLIIGLCGCSQEITSPIDTKSGKNNYFYIKNIVKQVVENVEPTLLKSIVEKLKKDGRTTDAINLLNTYDSKTGTLISEAKRKMLYKPTDWDPQIWKARAHVQNLGWLTWVRQGETCGTTGLSLRMEAFILSTDPLYPPYERPDIRYEAHVENIGWQGWITWDQIAGTTGQNLRIEALRCYSITSGYEIWYRAHVQDLGWLSWVSDGEIAGTTGQERRLEAFQMYIYYY